MDRQFRGKVHWGLVVLLSITFNSFGEGSKELNTGCSLLSTRLYLCNDFTTHCDNTGGIRSSFATYTGTQSAGSDERLYFATRPNEIVYMGFNGYGSFHPLPDVVYRICDSTGAVVSPESIIPLSSTGFISGISQACNGPNQLLPLPANTGYDAIVWTPPHAGTYYIEFSQKSLNFYIYGHIIMDLFDITIYNTASASVQPGRLYSKSWQFSETNGFTSKTYILTDEGIATSAEFNGMHAGIWIQYANQTGCGNTNWISDRRSLFNQQAWFPGYKIFLNQPDPNVFPVTTKLGNIIPPEPSGSRNCDGSVDFTVNIDKAGYVSINLVFSPSSYSPRTLDQAVTAGQNVIHWDGKDGNGNDVPNSTLVGFTVKYLNGITNLPLYNVSGNENGIMVKLLAQAGKAAVVYWDDMNIWTGSCSGCGAGNGPNPLENQSNVNSGGCPSPNSFPACHKWPGTGTGWGNLNTINTWWYIVSSETTYPAISEWRNPQPLLFNGGPQTVCPGTYGIVYSVKPDSNTEVYHWGYTGTGVTFSPSDTTSVPNVSLDFSTTATAGNITVYGTNKNCSIPSPVISLAISMYHNFLPPDLGPDRSLCQGPLAFLDAGTGYDSVYWSNGDTTRKIQVKQGGKYWVRVHKSGCTGSDTVTISLYPFNPTSLKPDTAICDGQSYILNPGKNFTSLLWSTGDTTPTLRIIQGGRYWVRTSDVNNCIGSDTVTIGIKSAINIKLVHDTSICANTTITLNATVPGAAYQWQDGSQDPLFTVTVPGIYWVKVSRDGCAVVDSSIIQNCSGAIYFPTAFASGSEVGNRYFHPIGQVLSKFTLSIFNRFGQQIFTTDNQETGWDGTCKGELCPADVYVYTVSYELGGQPGTTFKMQGEVSLIR